MFKHQQSKLCHSCSTNDCSNALNEQKYKPKKSKKGMRRKKSEGKFNLNDKFNIKCKQKICNFCEGSKRRRGVVHLNILKLSYVLSYEI